MKNIVKFLTFFISIFYIYSSYAMDFGTDKVDNKLKGGTGDFITTITNIISYLVGLVFLIAIVYGIYAGFQILVSGGDDGKVKEGKKTMIYVVIGLTILLISSVIVNWAINTVTDLSK
ncbi:MAG: pilin [Candidatus Gracilibacteria bacterium]|nr:pilin [Candidatus Gracilibacteria bacterium]